MNQPDRKEHVRQFLIGLILFIIVDFFGFLFSVLYAIGNSTSGIMPFLPIGGDLVLTIACVVFGFYTKKSYFALGVLMAPVVVTLGIGACNLLFPLQPK
jgi:hypothetical protein